jgi:hypothetical protein
MPQAHDRLTFEVEHVVPKKHGGPTVSKNLALACFPCNRFKGPNLSGIDPNSGEIIPLFNPRIQSWNEHFQMKDGRIEGLSAIGRATSLVMRMNDPMRVALRQLVITLGDW